jgi:hypothetical protein
LPDKIVGMSAESIGMGELAGFSTAFAELAEFAELTVFAALPELDEPNVVVEPAL